MRKQTGLLGVMLVVGNMLLSCSQNTGLGDSAEYGQGELTVALKANARFNERGAAESAYENTDNYTIVVTDKDGVKKMECKGSEVRYQMPLPLSMGSYKVQAYYGTEHDASRDEFFVYGEAEGTIEPGVAESVSLTCVPTCGRITVNFGDLMDTFFSDYRVTFSGTEALGTKTIAWEKGDTRPWYVRLNEEGETVSFTISTTTHEEFVNGNQQTVATRKGRFRLGRNKAYKMNISPDYNPAGVGNVGITITVDDSTNDIPVDIEIPVDWV